MRPKTSVIPVEPQVELSCPPELTNMQFAFCQCYVRNGDGNARKAAREAGYSLASANTIGWRMLQQQAVLSCIANLTALHMSSLAPMAVATMKKLAMNAKSEFVRQNAAADILDRTGFKPPDRRDIAVTGAVTISINLGD